MSKKIVQPVTNVNEMGLDDSKEELELGEANRHHIGAGAEAPEV